MITGAISGKAGNMSYDSQERTIKQRILDRAATLFAEKGFSETTIRELAEAAGFKNSASLYYHFPSKNAILEYMLEDYIMYNNGIFRDKNISEILKKDPTTTGIIACLQTSFPPDKAEYYLKVLAVLMQEQFRNPIVCDFMTNHFILRSERNIKAVISELKELGIISRDCDYDYWVKITSGLFHTFSIRRMLGIGDNSPDFTGMGMTEMLKSTFEMMFEKCGVKKTECARQGVECGL